MKITTLSNFPLKWRWTDEKYCILADDELTKIIPLHPESARYVWEKSLTFIDKNSEFTANPLLFSNIEKINSHNSEFVQLWLSERMSNGNITISWQPEIAAKTTTELFIKYWSEFCYASSDDVSIWPDDESWVLHYWHEEMFCFGRA